MGEYVGVVGMEYRALLDERGGRSVDGGCGSFSAREDVSLELYLGR